MPHFENPPLKHHPALQPFSRDHYQGLVQAQHLIKSADGEATDRRRVLGEFLDAWEREIEPHFLDEERLLAELADPVNRQRMLDEHDQLRGLAAEARVQRKQVDPGAAWMRSLGERFVSHIRWEERNLFVAIESTTDRDRLSQLEQQTRQIEADRNRPRFRRDR